MITTVLNNGLTQLEAESGKWLTENFPTMFRRFLKKLVLSTGQTAESWRDAEDEEKQSFTPPERGRAKDGKDTALRGHWAGKVQRCNGLLRMQRIHRHRGGRNGADVLTVLRRAGYMESEQLQFRTVDKELHAEDQYPVLEGI